MDRDELQLHQAAMKIGLSIFKVNGGTWGIMAAPDPEPLGRPPHEPFETLLSQGRVRLPDGREFKREMTTPELRVFLGIDAIPSEE